ncbi:MAG: DinB family protein [Acidimicrobiia bacterium]|nr:MAG: DinB family protein [Acidimicrobiia bacterium]
MTTETPLVGEEKDTLHAFLKKQRAVMLWKLEDLSDEDLRRPMVPSGTNLLGMVKHLAAVEYGWFCPTFGVETEPLPFDESDPESDLRVDPDESTQDILDFYDRAQAAVDAIIDAHDLDDTGKPWTGEATSLRWIIVHLIEETARHAGHADIIRELIDGGTGYLPPRD